MDWLLAESASEGGLNLGILAQYGVLGCFSVMLVIFARTSYKRETDRSDRNEAEIKVLNEFIRKEVMSVVTTATRALEDNARLLTEMAREREAYLLAATPRRRRGEEPK